MKGSPIAANLKLKNYGLLCKRSSVWALRHTGMYEYHHLVLIRPRSREGLLRLPFRGGANGSENGNPILKVTLSLAS